MAYKANLDALLANGVIIWGSVDAEGGPKSWIYQQRLLRRSNSGAR